MTIGEVADRVRRPVGTLRQWRHRGVGPKSFRLRGRVMYRANDVEAWLTAQVAESGSGTGVAEAATK